MIFREAQLADIPQIQIVRNSVKENTLSDPALVTDKDCENYLVNRGSLNTLPLFCRCDIVLSLLPGIYYQI